LLLRGYSRKQVDALCEHITRHFDSQAAITVDEVRRVVFNAKRGGYVEAQVDAFIDRVIEALQIEQNR
jgi:DivIVA domain-containing protein